MADDPRDAGRLESRLGYTFRDPELLRRALTHASATENADHNERLEFLGDAVLNLVVAEALYRNLPHSREGRLTELKSMLVARRTLERVAMHLELEPHLHTGSGLDSGAGLPPSVLGNALEALIGAIYLDRPLGEGLGVASQVALALLEPEIERIPEEYERQRAKSLLQAHAQRHHGCLPRYLLLDTYEHPRASAFQVAVELAGRRFPPSWGKTKKDAERNAAVEALLVLRAEGRYPDQE